MNKKGNGLFGGFILVVLMAAIITGSLVAGYKFLRYINKDAAEKMDGIVQTVGDRTGIDLSGQNGGNDQIEPVQPNDQKDPEKQNDQKNPEKQAKPSDDYAYKQQSSRTYDGTKLYESYSYIYNDKGEVLTNFYEENSYGLEIYFDADRKHGILRKFDNCYVINPDLTFKQIASNCSYAGISYDGSYAFYTGSHSGLWLYNLETGEETFITDSGLRPVLSPDGKTVAYYGYDGNKKALLIGGIDREIEVLETTDTGFYDPAAVSNDGNTIYYEISSGNNQGFYCMHNGQSVKLMTGYFRTCHFDRTCEKALYQDGDHAYYYDLTCEEPVLVLEEGYLKDVEIFGVATCKLEDGTRSFIVDTDCMSDVAMINTGDYSYCLEGEIPTAVMIRDDGYAYHDAITAEGPTCVYRERDGGAVIKAVYKNGRVEESELFEDSSFVEEIEYCEDPTEGFYTEFHYDGGSSYTHYLYHFKEGEEPVFIADCGKDNFQIIRWDKLFKKCYYISNGDLYSTSGDWSESTYITSECENFEFTPDGDDTVHFDDVHGKEHVLVNNNVFDL